ncbi:hypothetical protein J2X76_004987 [Neorhizobium sp. 2083]|nr:hypothetical protein [Neorhizobium sp. 2083]
MRLILVLILGCVALSGCGGKYEQLAKCSADENPVPALGYDDALKPTPPVQALSAAMRDDCGPMRPVNQF